MSLNARFVYESTTIGEKDEHVRYLEPVPAHAAGRELGLRPPAGNALTREGNWAAWRVGANGRGCVVWGTPSSHRRIRAENPY